MLTMTDWMSDDMYTPADVCAAFASITPEEVDGIVDALNNNDAAELIAIIRQVIYRVEWE